jgi:hypothetical protein
MGLILLIVLVLILFGSFPIYPYNRNAGWGYYPAGGVGLLLLILLLLLIFGAFPWY